MAFIEPMHRNKPNITYLPGSQGAATTISPAVPCGNRDTIPARTAGEIVSRAASACRSIMRAIVANIFPGGSVAVTTLYVSAARVKSTLTLSSLSGPLMALSGSSNCCRQRLARFMCQCARHMVRTAAAKAVSILMRQRVIHSFLTCDADVGIFPVYILVKAWNSFGGGSPKGTAPIRGDH